MFYLARRMFSGYGVLVALATWGIVFVIVFIGILLFGGR